MLGRRVGIDPGALTTRVVVRGDSTVLADSSCAALEGGSVVATGDAARQVAAERPAAALRWPVTGAGITDRVAYEAVLTAAIARGCGRQRIFKPDLMVAVPSVASGEERRAILDICARAGARAAYLIERPLAAAIGSAMPVASPSARMVVDIGASSVDVAVLAREGAVVRHHHPHGGADVTAAVGRAVAAEHGVEISMADAEELKRAFGAEGEGPDVLRLPARRAGAPVEVRVRGGEVLDAARPWIGEIVTVLARTIADAPAALHDDVVRRNPVLLTGGGALLRGLERRLGEALGLRVAVAGEPALAVARGTANALESLDVVRRTFLYVR